MNEQNQSSINKRQYWQDQIKFWEKSELSQSDYCYRAGIKLSSFTYWRGVFITEEKKDNRFAVVKVLKNEMTEIKVKKPIEIKLLSGHTIYLPIEMGINEIVKLIHLMELSHA